MKTLDYRGKVVLAVVPESHSGPGWTNTTLAIYTMPVGGGEVSVTRLQPEEWSDVVSPELFEVGRVAALELIRCVRSKARSVLVPG